jgi:hypothetical protein
MLSYFFIYIFFQGMLVMKHYLYRNHIKYIYKFNVLNLFSVCQGRQPPYGGCCSGKEPPGSAQCPPPFCCNSNRYFPVNI